MTDPLGTKSIALGGNISDVQARLLGIPTGGNIGAREAYERVGFLRRAVKILANAVADMPYTIELLDGEDVTESPQVQKWKLKTLLWKTQAAVTIYGSAYWLIETNRYGLGATPRWLLPPSITPQIDPDNGLISFQRTTLSGSNIPLTRMVYFWEESMTSAVGPGASDVSAAMAAANILYSLDEFARGVFERGGMKLTLMSVEGNPRQEEVEKIALWWKQVTRGLKKAWETLFIKFNVTPHVIGSDIRDTAAPELLNAARENIMATIGVPNSLIMSNAANYATAAQDWLNLYTNTATPQAQRMAETINEQFLRKLGMRMVLHPEQLEAYQQFELQKASALAQLTGEPIFTRAMALDYMGYTDDEIAVLSAQPMPSAATVSPAATLTAIAQPQIDVSQQQQAQETAAVQDVALNGAQVTAVLSVVSQVSSGELTYEQGLNALQIMFGMSEEQATRLLGEQKGSALAAAELRRWKRKALKSPAAPFASDVLEATQQARITAALQAGAPLEQLFARELRALGTEADPELADIAGELRALRAELEKTA